MTSAEPSIRGAVAIVEDGHVALIERVRDDRTYYLFPGGGALAEETADEAAIREARGELGLEVELGVLLLVVEFVQEHVKQFYFEAKRVGGHFGTGTDLAPGPEHGDAAQLGTYEPVWLSLDEALERDVRPRDLVVLLRWRASG